MGCRRPSGGPPKHAVGLNRAWRKGYTPTGPFGATSPPAAAVVISAAKRRIPPPRGEGRALPGLFPFAPGILGYRLRSYVRRKEKSRQGRMTPRALHILLT